MLRLDPDCWSLQPCGERRAAYLRLSQLCELVRLQNEKAVAESRAGQERMPGGLLRKEEQEALRSALVRAIQLPRDRVVPAVAARKRYWLSWFRELFAPRRDEIDAAPAVLQMPPPPARDESDDALRAANALGERAAPRQDRQAV
jgi:hypothetical protein